MKRNELVIFETTDNAVKQEVPVKERKIALSFNKKTVNTFPPRVYNRIIE